MKTKEVYYNSISEVIARANAPFPEDTAKIYSEDSREHGKSFTGTESFQEASELAFKGWSAGRKRLLESQKEINFAGSCMSLDPAPFFDVAGDECNVARFLEGEPENMIEFQYEYSDKPANKVQKITLDFCASGSTPKDVFPRVGACMLMIADALEGAGYRVEIDLSAISRTNGLRYESRIQLKPADQPLDLNALAFWSMHPSAFRRFWFALYERDVPCENFCSSYGSIDPVSKNHDEEIVLHIMDSHFQDDARTFEFCNEVLSRFNDQLIASRHAPACLGWCLLILATLALRKSALLIH